MSNRLIVPGVRGVPSHRLTVHPHNLTPDQEV